MEEERKRTSDLSLLVLSVVLVNNYTVGLPSEISVCWCQFNRYYGRTGWVSAQVLNTEETLG